MKRYKKPIVLVLLAVLLVGGASRLGIFSTSGEWWNDCPPDPPTLTPWPLQPTLETQPTYLPQPTYTPNPIPTCRPTATLAPNPSPTPYPTHAPYLTYTPFPTHTPYPTQPYETPSTPVSTLVPTATPQPTATPTSTPANTPTPTNTPTHTPTQTPVPPTPIPGQVLAFPGAEGFGANSVGGRGGRIIEVTNLNDSGAGSLRAAIDAEGARTVVFRTGGTIELQSRLYLTNPFITIAGQTAPGGGITIKGGHIIIQTHDVIMRHVRTRPGPDTDSLGNNDALEFHPGAIDVIVDHCSFSWSTDEIVSFWQAPVSNITVQWSIISEALNCSNHPKGCHALGILADRGPDEITFHHNLISHVTGRPPKFIVSRYEFANNVFYDIGGPSYFAGSDDLLEVNLIGNYYKRTGEEWGTEIRYTLSAPIMRWYVHDNKARDVDSSEDRDAQIECKIACPEYLDSRLNYPEVTYESATSAFNSVLLSAGATLGLDSQGNSYTRRDAVDKRLAEQARTGQGQVIDAPGQSTLYGSGTIYLTPDDYTKYGIEDPIGADGWPILSPGTPHHDTDHDGMPNAWEILHGFDPYDPSDGPADADGDGHTNVEEYLNGSNPRGE